MFSDLVKGKMQRRVQIRMRETADRVREVSM
jgi:hypothetical protein